MNSDPKGRPFFHLTDEQLAAEIKKVAKRRGMIRTLGILNAELKLRQIKEIEA